MPMKKMSTKTRPTRVLLAIALFIAGLSAQAQDTYGPVRHGDDLWDIAARVYHDRGVTRDQGILALLKANPQAFSSPCNASSVLEVGAVLEVPSVAEANAVSSDAAVRELARQAREWKEHVRTGQPLVCPPVEPTAAETPRVESAEEQMAVQPSGTPPRTEMQEPMPVPAPAAETSPVVEPSPVPEQTEASAQATAEQAPAAKQSAPSAAVPAESSSVPRAESPAPAPSPGETSPPLATSAERPEPTASRPPSHTSASAGVTGKPSAPKDWLSTWGRELEPEFSTLSPLDWIAIPVVLILVIGIFVWKFRRKRTAARPIPAAKPPEAAEDFAELSVEQAVARLESNAEQGLTADQAQRRLGEYGPNALEEKHVTLLERVLPFFWGPIPWMIEAAALLSLITEDWKDFIVITALLLFNAAIGFWEEHSAANALAALKGQLAVRARAMREGRWQEIPAADLVPGDIIRIRLGDIVPADAKLIDGDYLSLDQSALTGESLPVNKQSGEMAFSGSVAKQGEMAALVTGTGADTFFGRTAKLVESAGAKSHLQAAVLQIGNFLIVSAIVLVIILVTVKVAAGASALHVLKIALVLLVASIPVAMPAVLSVTMALGALALSKLKAIVSRMEAIEEMAGVDVLCSDKTGTLTVNQLTLGESKPFGVSAQELILAGALASRAENNDPIDLAVIGGLKEPSAIEAYRQLKFSPFDPVSKRTEASIQGSDGASFRVTKGAPQVILELSGASGEDLQRAERLVDEAASVGYRTLGVARTDAQGNWQFLGILPLFDPPRRDSAATIAEAKRYGLSVKMITGDNLAIAKQTCAQLAIGTNILGADTLFAGGVVHGEVPAASARLIEEVDGFAQVYPEHKYGIVKALQQRGHIVAMTGDGANDAPALKQAEVGIAVSGATDAARSAAALVLTAPGLSVITHAIEESRRIFERMMSYIIYRIAMSIDIMLFVVMASLVFNFFPLTAIMLVVLALLDDLPIMSIAYDNTDPDPKPVRWNRTRTFSVSIVLGLFAVAQSFGFFVLGLLYLKLDPAHLQTMLFLQLLVGGHLLLLVTRTKKPFWARPYPSWKLLVAVFGTQVLAVLMAAFGWLVPAVSWELIGLLWAYNLIWMLVLDFVKLGIYRFLDVRARSRDVFSTHTEPYLGHVNEPAQGA
jgi:H+-transporting ATPase